MLAIMLIAVMVDRRAITLRNVALAGLLIMIAAPESVLTVSFQMSFAATIALVSGYEAISAWRDRRLVLADRRDGGMFGRLGRYATGLFLTSLIAGLATAPFGAFHFQRVAPLTLIANLAAMPAVGLIVMPMALLAVVVMPLGLEYLPLSAMSWGLAWVGLVAERTTEWSIGYGGVRMAPAATLLLTVAGLLWLALWRERWRLAGIVPVLLAVPIVVLAPRPVLIVDAEAKAVALRGSDGRLTILGGKGANFEVENWLRADADIRPPDAPDLRVGTACDALGCIGRGPEIGTVALVERREAFNEDCRAAAIVISQLPAPPGCERHALAIDRGRFERFGAHAIFVDSSGLRVETALPEQRRPFMPRR
jgi:competence protein ComEC